MSGSTSPKKTVRFALDEIEPSQQPATDATTPSPTQDAPKKTVRFALEDDAAPVAAPPTATTFHTLLDTSTSLATPLAETPLDFSAASQTSSSTSPGHSTTSTLSPTDIRTCSETVSSSTPIRSSPALSLANPIPPEPVESTTLHHSSSGVSVMHPDAGEKDGEGKVMEASTEPCEKCGGKIVWATKGEWLMICEECKEPR